MRIVFLIRSTSGVAPAPVHMHIFIALDNSYFQSFLSWIYIKDCSNSSMSLDYKM